MRDSNVFTPGLSFFTVNQYRHTQGHVCDFRQSPRPHYCMGLIEVGEGIFESEEERICVRPGEIIFVPIGSCYRSIWHGAQQVCYTSMHFFFDGMPPFDSTRHLPLQKLCPADPAATARLYRTALLARNGSHAEHLRAVGLFYQLLGELLPHLQYGIGKKRDERMEAAAQYLQGHYSTPIAIGELAALCHMSPSHFHACFQKTFGMTPIAYKHRICIRHAILELMRGKDSVEQISARLGFESAIYFRRVFKKVTGKSPTAYLKSDVE